MGEGIQSVEQPDWETRKFLKEWWRNVLQENPNYRCYAFFIKIYSYDTQHKTYSWELKKHWLDISIRSETKDKLICAQTVRLIENFSDHMT